jgi:ribosomal protein L28
MKELVIKKIFETKKIKPLFGQNRPKKGGNYPRSITKRKFNPN